MDCEQARVGWNGRVNAARLRLLPLLLALLLPAACSQHQAAGTTLEATKGFADYFRMSVGDRSVRLQLAVLPHEQEQGLMHRRDLGTDDGMVFVYSRPQAMSYWMRNTPTALDIGYFDATGTLLEVYAMLPFDETPIRSRSSQIQYCVEMQRGWYSAHGVKPGARFDLKGLAEALRQRGMDPVAMHVQP